MRFTSLSSGSEGNALVIESRTAGHDPTRIMIDCGLNLKDASRRLEQRGLLPQDIDAIFVTHEHGDHIGGVAKLARAANIPVLLSHGTCMAAAPGFWSGVRTIEVESHAQIRFGDLSIQCFPVPHDAREPVQVVVDDGSHRLGVLTDVGRSTPHIEAMLSASDALFLEANHDYELLQASDYPPSLKERIGGDYGHLSNEAAANLLKAIDQSRLQQVIAAHLSRHNNRADLVEAAFRPALLPAVELSVASQVEGFDWVMLA